MKIAIGADHAGYLLKEDIKRILLQSNITVEDYGTHSEVSVDYPDIALRVAEAVSEGREDRGILICGSGIGMSIVANKVKGVRAALCTSAKMAEMARKHNDANLLSLGARLIEKKTAETIVGVFLNTESDPAERHRRRVAQIHELTHR